MSWGRDIRIEFNHCDPAGIVFYGRYFEMTNSVLENFFREVVEYPYEDITMRDGCGVPTVHAEADFRAPCYLGELIRFDLAVRRIGGASADFVFTAHAGGTTRLKAAITMVWIGPDERPAPWPDRIRDRLALHLSAEENPS